MRIGELAARAGVSVRSLRYYEQQRLLSSERAPSGQRHYPDSAVARVQLIQQLYIVGLTSRLIADLLPCFETGEVTREMIECLSVERDRIAERAATFAKTRDRLDRLIHAAVLAEQQGQPACWTTSRRESTAQFDH